MIMASILSELNPNTDCVPTTTVPKGRGMTQMWWGGGAWGKSSDEIERR